MSILIKGMEMPESCWMCFARTDVNIGVGIADGCNLLKEMISNPKERLPDCPLIPVPPHGRLIDADALYRRIKTECNPYGKPTIGYDEGNKVMHVIIGTLTIIPADKEDSSE